MRLKQYLLAILLCLGIAPSAFACAYCRIPEMQFGGMYPGSFTVAVADNGVINAAALQTPGTGGTLHIKSVGRLHAFRKAIRRALDAAFMAP